MNLGFVLYDMGPATVFVIAFIEFFRMMHKNTSQSARDERIRHLAVRSVRAHRRAKTVTRAAVAAPPKCQHPEVVDVENSGEVVARLCMDPECWEQLPADFEPPPEEKFEPFVPFVAPGDDGDLNVFDRVEKQRIIDRTPLLLSSTPPPSDPVGQRWMEYYREAAAVDKTVKVWSGKEWEVVSQRDASLKRLQFLEERAKELTRKMEQHLKLPPGTIESRAAQQTDRPM